MSGRIRYGDYLKTKCLAHTLDFTRFVFKTYNDSINISLKVGFPQRSSWAVGKEWKWLADTIDAWSKNDKTIARAHEIKQRYFEMNKHHLDSMRALSDSVSTIIEQAKKQGGG